MKIDRHLIYQIAGISMIVGSFFNAARGMGGVITILYLAATTNLKATDKSLSDYLLNILLANHLPNAIYGIASFVILFFGGRWMIRGPKMIENWIVEKKEPAKEPHGNPSDHVN